MCSFNHRSTRKSDFAITSQIDGRRRKVTAYRRTNGIFIHGENSKFLGEKNEPVAPRKEHLLRKMDLSDGFV